MGAVLVFRDVTERQSSELARAHLAAIVESSDDAIISKTLEGVVRSWNAGVERVFGYTAQEAVGRPITFLIPPERLHEEEDTLARIARGERIEHFDTVRVTKDGRRIDISLTVSPHVMRLAESDPQRVRKAQDVMERHLNHMVRLVDDLLDISRISQNKLELRRERVLLSDVVNQAVETARPAIEAAGHELTISIPTTEIYLDADPTRLSQVLSNLLTNSAKYTDRGGSILIAAEQRHGEIAVSLRDTGVGPLFRPFAEQLVARLGPHLGDSVIDVACGTGICARVARERLGPEALIVGVDVAPAMLAVARTVDRTIDWREGNATVLPVSATERFSLLTCHQGLQFVGDKPAAVREMRRVLAPAGRVGIATWGSLQDNPGVLELNAVAERHVGRIIDSRHSFGEAEGLTRLLIDSGFGDVTDDVWSHDVQFADGALFARLNAMAVIGMSDKGKAMSEVEREELAGRIVADSQEVVARATRTGTFVLRFTGHIATGYA